MPMELVIDCFMEYIDFSPSVEFKAVAVDVKVHCLWIGLFVVMQSIDGECSCCLVEESLCLLFWIISSNHP